MHRPRRERRHLSEPRYKLVALRALVAKQRAQRVRRRAFCGKELALDFLFPGEPQPQRNKQARRYAPRLPDEIFSIIACYYWGGGLSADEEVAAAAEAEESE